MIEYSTICFNPDVVRISAIQFTGFMYAGCLRFFFGFLPDEHHRGAHPSDLFIAMDFGNNVMDDVVKGFVEDVGCLSN